MTKKLGIELKGTVTLADLAKATAAFAALIDVLTKEADIDRPEVEWVLSNAKGGSFSATATGVASTQDGKNLVNEVNTRFGRLGDDARIGRIVDYSPMVQKHVGSLTSLINGKIPEVHFKTGRKDVAITRAIGIIEPVWKAPDVFRTRDYIRGALRGKLRSLGDEQGLCCGLEDPRTGYTVRCYPDERWAAVMQNNWRKWVVVEGMIHREQFSGKPLTIHDVTEIKPLKDDGPDAYRMARGCISSNNPKAPSIEDALRRVRNAKRA